MATENLEQIAETAIGKNRERAYQLMPEPERNKYRVVIRNAIALEELYCEYCKGHGKGRIPKGSAFLVSESTPQIPMCYHSKECQDSFTED